MAFTEAEEKEIRERLNEFFRKPTLTDKEQSLSVNDLAYLLMQGTQANSINAQASLNATKGKRTHMTDWSKRPWVPKYFKRPRYFGA